MKWVLMLILCFRIDELRRILVAYSIYDPELGYCQGLNFIAFMLLIHLEESVSFFEWRLFYWNCYLFDIIGCILGVVIIIKWI